MLPVTGAQPTTSGTSGAADTPDRQSRLAPLLSVPEQAENLIALGVGDLLGLPAPAVRTIAADLAEVHEDHDAQGSPTPALLVLPGARSTDLAALMRRGDKAGFVVADMTDVEQFSPTGVQVPSAPYLLNNPDRGDHLRNTSPEESRTVIEADGRTPLTLTEGIFWVLAQPEALEPNYCFMTIGSRLRKPDGRFDSRTPALWISGGTGRDGAERKNAAKVGWCWWRNRHTWLGIASAAGRTLGR